VFFDSRRIFVELIILYLIVVLVSWMVEDRTGQSLIKIKCYFINC